MNIIRSILKSTRTAKPFGKKLLISSETVFGYYYDLLKEKHKQGFERNDISFEEYHLRNMIDLWV